jgi:hypothetical protein
VGLLRRQAAMDVAKVAERNMASFSLRNFLEMVL